MTLPALLRLSAAKPRLIVLITDPTAPPASLKGTFLARIRSQGERVPQSHRPPGNTARTDDARSLTGLMFHTGFLVRCSSAHRFCACPHSH